MTAPGGGAVSHDYTVWSLPDRVVWSGAVQGIVGYHYDYAWRLDSIGVHTARSVGLEYDRDGLLTRAGSPPNAPSFTLIVDRYPDTGLVRATALDAVTDTWGYNVFGELTGYSTPGVWAQGSSARGYAAEYARDRLGRVTQKLERLGQTGPTHEYRYDAAGRLEHISKDGSVVAQYGYDTNGNRTSVTTPAGTITATYDDQDRILQHGSATYAYTANGERQSHTNGGQTTSYAYDFLGNLAAVTLPDGRQVSYVVDGAGRRIGRRVNGTLQSGYLYQDGHRVVAELDGNSRVISQFIYGTRPNVPDFMLVRVPELGEDVFFAYRIISDHLGSPRFVVEAATNQIMQVMEYDAFGNVTLDTSPGFQPFGFAGGLYDRDTRLVRFGARDYDPDVGRWITRDSILFAAGDTNLYAYVSNDPVTRIDVTGFGPKDRFYGLPKDFQRWYHRQDKWRIKGYPDADQEELQEAFEEWKNRGRPTPEGKRTEQSCPAPEADGETASDDPATDPQSATDPAIDPDAAKKAAAATAGTAAAAWAAYEAALAILAFAGMLLGG